LWTLAVCLTALGLVILALNSGADTPDSIGWLFLVTGVCAALEDVLLGYATHALLADPGSLPAGAAVGVLADVLWVPTLVCGITLLFLLFPDGRLPSPGWRWLVRFTVALAAAYALGTIVLPGPIYFFDEVVNPFGVDALDGVAQVVVDMGGMLVLPTGVAGMVALGVRFRRSSRDARQQIKWLVYAIPGAVGVAILRHRLYDVDVVINRTLVYAGLTAILAGAYFACVLLFQLALSPVTEDSGLAVAGSTLAVAALFRPARARIQAAVDQRFYRRRYDAQRTLDAFTGRLRDELDLDTLGADVRAVVRETVQPVHVSQWLRSSR
jgi:hypothetical protein